MIVLLWILLFLLPTVAGLGILSVSYRRKEDYRITISESFVLGVICCIGLAELAHVAGLFVNLSLAKTSIVFAGALFTVVLAAVAVVLLGVREGKHFVSLPVSGKNGRFFLLTFWVIFLLQTILIVTKENIVTPGDITLETVQSFWAEDGIYRVMPLTGMPSEQGMPFRYTILCLPTLYAVLCRLFQVDPEFLVTQVIPIVILCASYSAYGRLSSTLFGEERYKERFTFLAAVACIFLFTDRAVYLDGYSALHSGYLGTSIRNLVLVPYVLSALMERRWWKVVLCILAEACIAWTFWGCGICLVITAGMLIITTVDKKCPFLRKFMQFFRNKEELL